MTGLRITPKPVGRGPRGKRGRRAAFYWRARMARRLQRVANELGSCYNAAMAPVWRDMLVYGVGFVRIESAPLPEPDDFDPEWDGRPALRVRHISREEFEGEFPGLG